MKAPPRRRTRTAFVDERVRSWTGLSLTGAVSLLAVVSVLVFVSLPRLRGLARSENEADARAIVELLGRELVLRRPTPDSAAPTVQALADTKVVTQALSDADFLADGRLLRRHGYLFTVVRLEGGAPPLPPGVVLAGEPLRPGAPLAVQAWPWAHGRTGTASLLGTSDGRLLRHANEHGRWAGSEEPGPLTSWDGWRPVR